MSRYYKLSEKYVRLKFSNHGVSEDFNLVENDRVMIHHLINTKINIIYGIVTDIKVVQDYGSDINSRLKIVIDNKTELRFSDITLIDILGLSPLRDELDIPVDNTPPSGGGGGNGEPGKQGPKGDPGPEGKQGPKGEPGTPGAKGDTGTGTQGPKGDDGTPGTNGAQGPEGKQGIQGPKGDDGTPGTDGAQGPEGKQGIQGPKGNDGTPGAKGDTGTGTQGPKGDDGTPGTRGEAGAPGKSAYQYAVDAGYSKTEEEFAAALALL